MLDFSDNEFEEFNSGMEDGIPRIHVDSMTSKTDLELSLRSEHDAFYRRIIDNIILRLEGVKNPNPVAILVDEQGNEYDMQVEEDGFTKALTKANHYFISIEEYETCDLIKNLFEIIEKRENGLR